ncbi:hypothetical protein BJY00DRAFT_140545 [Aspergillus carlsbadensis]|nr:hypothetical protein BJY00DRAFT_140545 [Aspergillus carlsbadensis]
MAKSRLLMTEHMHMFSIRKLDWSRTAVSGLGRSASRLSSHCSGNQDLLTLHSTNSGVHITVPTTIWTGNYSTFNLPVQIAAFNTAG